MRVLVAQVYVEFELAGRVVRTATRARMDKDEDRSAFFDEEKILLTYKGAPALLLGLTLDREDGSPRPVHTGPHPSRD